jgi:hypothetical protein
VSTIANTLGISRSNLVRSMKGDLVVQRQRYQKEYDKDLLPAIQNWSAIDRRMAIVESRPY